MITVLRATFIEPTSNDSLIEVPYRLILDPVFVNSEGAFQFGKLNKLGEIVWTDVSGFTGARVALMIQQLLASNLRGEITGSKASQIHDFDLGKIDLR